MSGNTNEVRNGSGHLNAADAADPLLFFREDPEAVLAKTAEWEDDGEDEIAAAIRYVTAVSCGECPDAVDAAVAGFPLPPRCGGPGPDGGPV
ncbi:hypothetical protein [Halorarum salinum]|uniref:Uncharacterized protein n=1 Tax=Halorarum salinum TaxID=2743089 RepID=A0A7D5QCK9_9EURY|nr:hypothetical protein [Halobaculum salinum]QLG62640.1 hypothetical protein HUG12_13265 [Halobaculum salinum]